MAKLFTNAVIAVKELNLIFKIMAKVIIKKHFSITLQKDRFYYQLLDSNEKCLFENFQFFDTEQETKDHIKLLKKAITRYTKIETEV